MTVVTVILVIFVTLVIVTVATVAAGTVVIVTYFSKNNLTPRQQMRYLRTAFRDSRDVFMGSSLSVGEYSGEGSWREQPNQDATVTAKAESLPHRRQLLSQFLCAPPAGAALEKTAV